MADASFPNRPFNLRAEAWFIQSDIPNNRSLVGFQLVIDKRSYSPTQSSGRANNWMRLNGQYVHNFVGNGFNFVNGSNFLLSSGTFWIGHNADGTGSIAVEAAADFDILGATSVGVFYVGLPTIPRASNIQFVNPDMHNGVPGQPWQVASNRAASHFTHQSWYKFGSIPYTVALADWGATATWTPPLSLIEQMPNTTTDVGWMKTATYNNGINIGETEAPFRLTVPASYVPTIAGLAITEATAGLAANVGRYVKGISTLALEVLDAQGIAGSTITSRKIEILSGSTVLQTINAGQGTSSVLTVSGTLTVRATVTDSRGRTATLSQNITVLNWAPPVLTSVTTQRSLSNGTVDDDEGTYLRVNINASISSLVNGTERNSMGFRISTRTYGGTNWTLRDSGALAGTSFNGYRNIGAFSLTQAYEVLVEIYDEFMTSSIVISVPVAAIFMHWNASLGVGVGKFHENGRLDVNGDIYHRNGAIVEPVGVMLDYAGATAPAGWLMCEGQAVSRTTYAALFAAIGTAFGAGNGTTTFNIPNLKGRVTVGRDAADTAFDVRGETGGSKFHTHTEGDLKAAIGASAGDINALSYAAANTSPRGPQTSGAYTVFGNGNPTTSARGYNHHTNVYGTTAQDSSLQPYVVVSKIIKV